MQLNDFITWVEDQSQPRCLFFCSSMPKELRTIYQAIQQLNDSMTEDTQRNSLLASCRSQLEICISNEQVQRSGNRYECIGNDEVVTSIVRFVNAHTPLTVSTPVVQQVPELTVEQQGQLKQVQLMIKVLQQPILRTIDPEQLVAITAGVGVTVPELLAVRPQHPDLQAALDTLFEQFHALATTLSAEVGYFNGLLTDETLEKIAKQKYSAKLNKGPDNPKPYSLGKAMKKVVGKHLYFMHCSDPSAVSAATKQQNPNAVLHLAAYGPEGQRNGFYKAFMLLHAPDTRLADAQQVMRSALATTVTQANQLIERTDGLYQEKNKDKPKSSWRRFPSDQEHLSGRCAAAHHVLDSMLVGSERGQYLMFQGESEALNTSLQEGQLQQNYFSERYEHFRKPYRHCCKEFDKQVDLKSKFSDPEMLQVTQLAKPYVVADIVAVEDEEGLSMPLLGAPR